MRARLRILVLGVTLLGPYATASAQSPALSPIVDVTVNADSPVTINVVAIDPAEREVSLLSSLPTFAALNAPRSGMEQVVTTFTLAPGALDLGTYTAAMTATAGGMSAIEFFRIRVNPAGSPAAPIVSAPALHEATVGSTVEFVVEVADPDGGGIVSLAASSLPPGATFEPDANNATAKFSWVPAEGDAGEYDVVFSASAANGLPAGAVTHFRVAEPAFENNPPVLSAASSATVAAGSLLEVVVSAADPDGDPVGLVADPLPDGASFVDHGDDTGTFTWTPQPAQAGVHEISFSGDDGRGGTDAATLSVAVVTDDELVRCPRGPGFWTAQCAQRGNGSTKFDQAQMDELAAHVDASSDFFAWDQAFDGFHAALDPPRPMDLRKQTLRMYATLLANVSAGQLGLVGSDGQVVGLDPSVEIAEPCWDGVHSVADLMAAVEAELAEFVEASSDPAVDSVLAELKDCLEAVNDGSGVDPNCPENGDEQPGLGGREIGDLGEQLQASVHPNPLNPSTELSFRLPREGRVRVDVYDLQGRLVKTLLDEHRSTGEQWVRWDGSNHQNRTVPSGIYFLRVQTPQGEFTRRATVVK